MRALGLLAFLASVVPGLPEDRHVNAIASWNGDGTAVNPFQNVIEGVLDVPAGGIVKIHAGTYAEKMFITKQVTLQSLGGEVTIGRGVAPGFISCGSTMIADDDGDGIDDACEEALAQKYAPIIYHSSDESNFPTSVDWFIRRTSLWFFDDACDPTFFDPFWGDLKVFVTMLSSQQDLLGGVKMNECDAQYVVYSNGTRSNNKHRTFFLADLPDDDKIGSLDPRDWITYYHAYPNNARGVTIQYWRLYAYNDAANNHGGDWEAVHVVLDSGLIPSGVIFLGHTDFSTTPASQVQWEGTHPIVFSEGGGHASSATPQAHLGSPILARTCLGVPTIVTLADPCTFIRQETWKGGVVTSQNPRVVQLIGNNKPGGGLLNVGAKIAPMNGQRFIQYSGIWGNPGTLKIFSGYWGPAFNETGAGDFDDSSPPRALPAWGIDNAQTHLIREWQATATSP